MYIPIHTSLSLSLSLSASLLSVVSHRFYQEANMTASMGNNSRVLRISQELSSLSTSLPVNFKYVNPILFLDSKVIYCREANTDNHQHQRFNDNILVWVTPAFACQMAGAAHAKTLL